MANYDNALSDEIDSYEYWQQKHKFWNDRESLPVSANFNFAYVAASGNKTRRTVSISEYNGGEYLYGFCNLREAFRTFRVDRVYNCVDVETGEVVNDIPSYLLNKYKKSPSAVIDQIYPQVIDIFRVLFFVSKADSRCTKGEKELIKQTIRKAITDQRVTDKEIDKIFKKIDLVSLQGFKLAVGRIGKKSIKNLEISYVFSKKIAESDKKIHPAEKEALDYIEKKIILLKKKK